MAKAESEFFEVFEFYILLQHPKLGNLSLAIFKPQADIVQNSDKLKIEVVQLKAPIRWR